MYEQIYEHRYYKVSNKIMEINTRILENMHDNLSYHMHNNIINDTTFVTITNEINKLVNDINTNETSEHKSIKSYISNTSNNYGFGSLHDFYTFHNIQPQNDTIKEMYDKFCHMYKISSNNTHNNTHNDTTIYIYHYWNIHNNNNNNNYHDKYSEFVNIFHKNIIILHITHNNITYEIVGYYKPTKSFFANKTMKHNLDNIIKNVNENIHNYNDQYDNEIVQFAKTYITKSNSFFVLLIAYSFINNTHFIINEMIKEYKTLNSFICTQNIGMFEFRYMARLYTVFEKPEKLSKLIDTVEKNNKNNFVDYVDNETKHYIKKLSNYSTKKSLLSINSDIVNINKKSKINTDDDASDISNHNTSYHNIPNHIKEIIRDRHNNSTTETYKNKIYIDILEKFPWSNNDNKFDMTNFENILNDKIYGHTQCKNTITQFMTNFDKKKGHSIGLYGPPGIGKTMIGQTIAEACNIKPIVISLCGIDDPSYLNGHLFTYNNAQPGMILKKIVENKNSRCIIIFDEIDKIGKKNSSDDIMNILISITDETTGNMFVDKFFDIEFPLNNMLFIFTYNDKNKISPYLLDRIHEIELCAFNTFDKIEMTKKHILREINTYHNTNVTISNKMIEHFDIHNTNVNINIYEDALTCLINMYTYESGVRDLKRKLELVISRAIDSNTINITKDFIMDTFIDVPINKALEVPVIGSINLLSVVKNGVDKNLTMTILENHIGSDFDIIFQNNFGNSLRNSIMFSFNIIMKILKPQIAKNIKNYYKNGGICVYINDMNNIIDGSSASLSFCLCFLSFVFNKKINNNVAVTGDIDMNGNVTKIGNVVNKISNTLDTNIKKIIIPKDNEKDVNKYITKYINQINIEIVYVDNIKNAIQHTFLEEFDYDVFV